MPGVSRESRGLAETLEYAEYARNKFEAPYCTFEYRDTAEQIIPDVAGNRTGLGKGRYGLAVGLVDIFPLFGNGGFESQPSGRNLFERKPFGVGMRRFHVIEAFYRCPIELAK